MLMPCGLGVFLSAVVHTVAHGLVFAQWCLRTVVCDSAGRYASVSGKWGVSSAVNMAL